MALQLGQQPGAMEGRKASSRHIARHAGLAAAACLIGLISLSQVALHDAGCLWRHGLAQAVGTTGSTPPNITGNAGFWHSTCHNHPSQLPAACETPASTDGYGAETAAAKQPAQQQQQQQQQQATGSASQQQQVYFAYVAQLAELVLGAQHAHSSNTATACVPRSAHASLLPLYSLRGFTLPWAAIVAHGSDLGLAVALVLPQLVLAVLLAGALLTLGQKQQPQLHDSPSSSANARSPAATSCPSSRSSSHHNKQALLLAAVKLLPVAVGAVVALCGRLGLLQLHPSGSSTYLLLRHWSTPLVMASLTLLSQAKLLHKVACSVVHLALAAAVLALGHNSSGGPPGAAAADPAVVQPSILQPLAALLLLDVLLCPVIALLQRAVPDRSSTSASTSQAVSEVQPVPTADEAADTADAEQQGAPHVPAAAAEAAAEAVLHGTAPTTTTTITTTTAVDCASSSCSNSSTEGVQGSMLATGSSSSSYSSSRSISPDSRHPSLCNLSVSDGSVQQDLSSSLPQQQEKPGAADGSGADGQLYIHAAPASPDVATSKFTRAAAAAAEGATAETKPAAGFDQQQLGQRTTGGAGQQHQDALPAASRDQAGGSGAAWSHTSSTHKAAQGTAAEAPRTGMFSLGAMASKPAGPSPHVPATASSAAAAAAYGRQAMLLQQQVAQQQIEQLQSQQQTQQQQQQQQQQQGTLVRRPVLSFDQALAACARGVARGPAPLAGRSALYSSPMQHHVLSIKVPLHQAHHCQELVNLLAQHFGGAANMAAAAGPTGPACGAACVAQQEPNNPLLILPPVAVRGCFHLLLRLAAAPPGSSFFSLPIRELIRLLSTGTLPPQQLQQEDDGAAALQQQQQQQARGHRGSGRAAMVDDAGGDATLCHGGGGDPGRSGGARFSLQLDQQSPLFVTKQLDGLWRVEEDGDAAELSEAASDATAAAAAPALRLHSSCWLEPPCIRLPEAATAAASGGAGSTRKLAAAEREVVVCGVPAAAGPAVRVLLVQGSRVVADEVVTVQEQQQQQQQGGQDRQQVEDAAGPEPGLTARFKLPHGQLQPGPAVIYLLSPPPPPTAAAAAAPTATTSSCIISEKPACVCMWDCLPLLLLGSDAAEQELLGLFDDMCCELQQQQQDGQQGQPLPLDGAACSAISSAVSTPPTPGSPGVFTRSGRSSYCSSSSDGTAASSVQLRVYQLHWQPMLWDWHHAVYATGTSCISSITALAAALGDKPAAGAAAAGLASVSSGQQMSEQQAPGEPATVAATLQSPPADAQRTAAAQDTSAAHDGSSQVAEAKQHLAAEVLGLLTGRGLWQAAEEMGQHVTTAAVACTGAAAAAGGSTGVGGEGAAAGPFAHISSSAVQSTTTAAPDAAGQADKRSSYERSLQLTSGATPVGGTGSSSSLRATSLPALGPLAAGAGAAGRPLQSASSLQPQPTRHMAVDPMAGQLQQPSSSMQVLPMQERFSLEHFGAAADTMTHAMAAAAAAGGPFAHAGDSLPSLHPVQGTFTAAPHSHDQQQQQGRRHSGGAAAAGAADAARRSLDFFAAGGSAASGSLRRLSLDASLYSTAAGGVGGLQGLGQPHTMMAAGASPGLTGSPSLMLVGSPGMQAQHFFHHHQQHKQNLGLQHDTPVLSHTNSHTNSPSLLHSSQRTGSVQSPYRGSAGSYQAGMQVTGGNFASSTNTSSSSVQAQMYSGSPSVSTSVLTSPGHTQLGVNEHLAQLLSRPSVEDAGVVGSAGTQQQHDGAQGAVMQQMQQQQLHYSPQRVLHHRPVSYSPQPSPQSMHYSQQRGQYSPTTQQYPQFNEYDRLRRRSYSIIHTAPVAAEGGSSAALAQQQRSAGPSLAGSPAAAAAALPAAHASPTVHASPFAYASPAAYASPTMPGAGAFASPASPGAAGGLFVPGGVGQQHQQPLAGRGVHRGLSSVLELLPAAQDASAVKDDISSSSSSDDFMTAAGVGFSSGQNAVEAGGATEQDSVQGFPLTTGSASMFHKTVGEQQAASAGLGGMKAAGSAGVGGEQGGVGHGTVGAQQQIQQQQQQQHPVGSLPVFQPQPSEVVQASGAAAGGGDAGRWHVVFDAAGVEGYEPDAHTTSLLSTTRGINSVSTTTWFAIPTNSASAHALPPTSNYKSGNHISSSSRTTPAPASGSAYRRRRGAGCPDSASRHTGVHSSSSGYPYTPGLSYTPTPGNSSSMHGRGYQTPPAAAAVPPGHHQTPLKAPAAAAAIPPGHSHSPQAGHRHSRSQRKLVLFSPVRHMPGDACAIPSADYSRAGQAPGSSSNGSAAVASLPLPMPSRDSSSQLDGNRTPAGPAAAGGSMRVPTPLKGSRATPQCGYPPQSPAVNTSTSRAARGSSPGFYDSWASNISAAGDKDTVASVLELLTGTSNVVGASTPAAPLFSKRVISSSSSGSSLDDDDDDSRPGGFAVKRGWTGGGAAGGYLTPLGARKPLVDLFAGMQCTGRQPAAAGFGGVPAGTPVGLRVAVPWPIREDDTDDELPVSRAGKLISGALFSGSLPLPAINNSSCNNQQRQRDEQDQQQNQELLPQLPLLRISSINEVSSFSDDEHTPVHTPIADSPHHTPPRQIMRSHDYLWATPLANTPTPAGARLAEDLFGGSAAAAAAAAGGYSRSSSAGLASARPEPGLSGPSPRIRSISEAEPLHHHPRSLEPPRAPARPVPSVMLVPACETGSDLEYDYE